MQIFGPKMGPGGMFANSIRARAHSHGHAHDFRHGHAHGYYHGHKKKHIIGIAHGYSHGHAHYILAVLMTFSMGTKEIHNFVNWYYTLGESRPQSRVFVFYYPPRRRPPPTFGKTPNFF